MTLRGRGWYCMLDITFRIYVTTDVYGWREEIAMEAEGAGSAAVRDFDRASRWAAIVESSADAIRLRRELRSPGRGSP